MQITITIKSDSNDKGAILKELAAIILESNKYDLERYDNYWGGELAEYRVEVFTTM